MLTTLRNLFDGLIGRVEASSVSATHDPASRAVPGELARCISISLISVNYAPEMSGISVYSTGLARYLAQQGHAVRVFTAFSYYPQWKKSLTDRRTLFRSERDERVKLHRCYIYVPQRPSVLRRMLHELSFVLSATWSYLLSPRSDVTMIVCPPLALGWPIALLARLKGSLALVHVQDLQPDAAVDLGMMRNRKLLRVLYALEARTYRTAHRISTISPGMLARIAGKGVPRDKLTLFRNWANDDLVAPQPRTTALRAEWGLSDAFVVLYSGNLGVKQGLPTLIEAAKLLETHAQIVIVISGDGAERAALLELAKSMQLRNVRFTALQPVERLSELLATADVSVIPQRRGVNDIVLPSKLGNVLSSARPVVAAAEPGTELHRIVSDSHSGIVVPPEDATAIADAILQLYAAPAEREAMGLRGRAFMQENLSCLGVLSQFETSLTQWVHTARR